MNGDILTLTCIKPYFAHWGDVLILGKEYTGEVVYIDIEIVTDYDNYCLMVRSEYKNSVYTKRVNTPHFKCVCSDGQFREFCLLSDNELYSLGSDRSGPRPCFYYSPPLTYWPVLRLDEHFDYNQIRRDNIIEKLLNNTT